MPWPGITDFSEAVQNPLLCFKGTDLEAGSVSVNQRGLPLVFSGAFACVYSVTVEGNKFAVRCFTREVKDQQTRYNQLSEYLINVLPPSFVHFEFLEHGISLKGVWYPVVRMEWVEGESLSSFVGSHLNDPDALRRVAAQWRGGPAASLRGLSIAHNDLQHGNVMVQADSAESAWWTTTAYSCPDFAGSAARSWDTRTSSTPSGRQKITTPTWTISLPWSSTSACSP